MAPKKRKEASNIETVIDDKPAPAKQPKKPKTKAITEPTTDDNGWTAHPPSLIYKLGTPKMGTKIAAFDLDGTLVTVKSGAQFALRADDWRFFNSSVPEVVRAFHDDGFKVVIFTNQGGIKSALTGVAATKMKERVDSIIKAIGVPAQVVAATQKDDFRKPERGMWDFFVERGNEGTAPDLSSSFFVGDAAGREGADGREDDFADSDKGFASNVGVEFKTPEEVFGKPGGGTQGGAAGPNAPLAAVFLQLADKHKDNFWKRSAFNKAAAALEALTTKVTSGKAALKMEGIGKGSAAVIDEWLETSKIKDLDPAEDEKKAGVAKKEAEVKEQSMAFAFL